MMQEVPQGRESCGAYPQTWCSVLLFGGLYSMCQQHLHVLSGKLKRNLASIPPSLL
jgi:hypothetical protein